VWCESEFNYRDSSNDSFKQSLVESYAMSARPISSGHFLAWTAASAMGALVGAFALTVAIDPYGRLGIKKTRETTFGVERLAKVTRGRDADFDSAIVGNSTTLNLTPQHLDRISGGKFVSLAISGAAPRDILTVARHFIAHHPQARTVIVGLEYSWCSPEGLAAWTPFPFWLYSTTANYLLGLARETSTKLLLTVFEDRERLRKDGYQSYDNNFLSTKKYDDVEAVRKLLTRSRPKESENPNLKFPAARALAELVKASPPQIDFVIVWTPRYITFIPEPGTPAAQTDRSCKASLAEGLSKSQNVGIIDASGDDRQHNADPANFFDLVHYRMGLAERLEREIAAAIPVSGK
jgi:hypothetical protein